MFRRLTARESSIESTCREHAAARGYMFVKVTSVVGFPDRMLVLPQGRVVFVELKQPGQQPTRIQKHRAHELQELSHRTFVIDSVGAFINLMDSLEAEWKLRAGRELRRTWTEAGWIDH